MGDGRAMVWLPTENQIILCCLIIVKLQTCLFDKSNFPFKNLFFNCYFFICSKSFFVLFECFIHNIATLLYLPPKNPSPAHRPLSNHRPSPAYHPSPIACPPIPSPAHRPATFYTPQGGLFVPWFRGDFSTSICVILGRFRSENKK